MGRVRETKPLEVKKRRKQTSMDAREAQLIALAYDLAEQRLLDGTATSQEVTHFLKLGSTKDRLEKEIMSRQKELLEAKTDALQSAKRIESLYADAINAVRSYSSPSTIMSSRASEDNG